MKSFRHCVAGLRAVTEEIWACPAWKRLRGDLISMYKNLNRRYQQDGVTLLSVVIWQWA